MHRLLLEADVLNSIVEGAAGSRLYVGATFVALIVIALVGLPLYEKIREAIAKIGEPKIAEHNERADAHPDLRKAVELLRQAIADQQRQINALDDHRKESFQQILSQIQMLVDLLPRD